MSPLPDAARWRALDAALRVLLELDADAQAAWLAHHCATQPDLADELRRLLGHARRAGPLEALDAARLLGEALDAARPAAIEIGGWRLQQRLGAGGTAEVFLAERVHDGVRQVAAFKLMVVGFASPALRMRFLRERAILARLTDARIARYLDGGIATDGRPWLALEYVDGLPIDRYCMQHALGLRARVELFRDVVGAVAHAHRHLVVHRDIKPSNVLVSRDGQVKLLDFGIAKPLDEDGDVTQASARLLTPHYASPEQLRRAGEHRHRCLPARLAVVRARLRRTSFRDVRGRPRRARARALRMRIPAARRRARTQAQRRPRHIGRAARAAR